MIKAFSLLLIDFYQHFLSPIKGFNCAHHRLNKGDTCSNAIKKIVIESRLRDIPKRSQQRFRECKNASLKLAMQQQLTAHQADLPCDIGCVGDVGCFGDTQSSNCIGDSCSAPFDLCFDFPNFRRRTKIIVLIIASFLCLASAYYYGSRISKLEIRQLSTSERSDSIFEKMLARKTPSLRAAAITADATYYSNISERVSLEQGQVIEIVFPNAVDIEKLTRLELQDARFSAVQDLIVVGQTVDVIDMPEVSGSGKRFSYQFKSRWGF